MKMNVMKMNKLAYVILVMSLTQAANAEEEASFPEADHNGTAWGIGIGSVIGGVIAGPPGLALGASLGGSIGWGQDKDSALDQSLFELDQSERALEQSQTDLTQSRSSLTKSRQEISVLKRSNAQQSARLTKLNSSEKAQDDKHNGLVLQEFINHYSQEVYFRNGESDVPGYAQNRLTKLTDFLARHPDLNVMLKGYTDPRGSAEFNADLAQARVEGIQKMLVEQGVDPKRVTTQAMGETALMTTPNQAGDYVLDRRVSIELSLNVGEAQHLASIKGVSQ